MARPKKNNTKRVVSGRIPDYIYNVIIDYAKEHDCTISKAMEDILAGGINFLMMMENSDAPK